MELPSRSAADTRAAAARRRLQVLPSDTQPIDHIVIAVDIALLEIIQQASTLAHHLEQPAPGVIVFDVSLEVSSQLVNSLCQQRDLNLRRTCVGLVRLVLRNNPNF